MLHIGSGMWSNLISAFREHAGSHSSRSTVKESGLLVTVAPDNLIGAAPAIQFSLV